MAVVSGVEIKVEPRGVIVALCQDCAEAQPAERIIGDISLITGLIGCGEYDAAVDVCIGTRKKRGTKHIRVEFNG